MRCSLLYIFFLIALTLAGCDTISIPGQTKPADREEAASVSSKMPDTGSGNPAEKTETGLPKRSTQMRDDLKIVRMQIDSIELPAGTAGKMEKLWTYLDEEPVSLHSTVLGMNGFRVGIGKSCDWPEVESILSRQGGLSFQKKTFETNLGSPVHLELKTNLPVQNIFIFSDTQTLRGQHFPPGDNLFTMSVFLDDETGKDVIISAIPQIRTSTQYFDIETDNNDPRIVYKSRFYPLEEMAIRVKMPIEDFIVIGPGSQAGRTNSVAKHFLAQSRQGMDYERIFILKPQIIRVPVKIPAERSGK